MKIKRNEVKKEFKNWPSLKSLLAILFTFFAATCFPNSAATAQEKQSDWLQFRGAQGVSKSTIDQVALDWNENKNLKWKTKLPGPGASSPIVVGDRVFLTCYTGYGSQKIVDRKKSEQQAGDIKDLVRHLICFDRLSGKVLWQKSIDNSTVKNEDPFKGYLTYHGYATNTPISDGESVFAFFGKAGLVRFDMDGNQKWKTTFEGEPNKERWGSAASPIMFQENLIVNAIDECGKILAIRKLDGKVVWEFEAGTRMAYSTPALIKTKEGAVELIIAAPEKVFGIDPTSGKQKWFVNTTLRNEVNAAIIVDDDIAFVYGGYQGVGSVAVRAGGSGDATESHLLWQTKDTSYVSTPVLADGHLYWLDKQGIANCVDAESGERLYRSRVPGFGNSRGIKIFASMIRVGDQIFALSKNAGTFIWVANPEKFELTGRNVIEADSSDFNGSPAIVDNQIFIRSNQFLYCIQK